MSSVTLEDLEAAAARGCTDPDCEDPDCDTIFMRSSCCGATPVVSFTKGADHVHLYCVKCDEPMCTLAIATKGATDQTSEEV